jgi:hypothetical protein
MIAKKILHITSRRALKDALQAAKVIQEKREAQLQSEFMLKIAAKDVSVSQT